MLEHISFDATLRLVSDLHIGTGETEKLCRLRQKPKGMEEDPEVALIVRAADGTPIIPATSLKGALRKAALAADARNGTEEAEALFGAIKDTQWDGADFTDRGRIGCLWLRFAPLTEAGTAGDRPFWDEASHTLITTHVAIERMTGTAAEKKLFYVERVPDRASFKLRGVYTGTRAEAECDLPRAFGALARPEGLNIGADGKAGGGRVVLEGRLNCLRRYFDADSGEVVVEGPFEISVAADTAEAGIRRAGLMIFCRGPYLTIDPAKPRDINLIPAARRNDTTPLLPASSLLGVLRTRTAWLAATDAIGDGDDLERILQTGEDTQKLTRTERLFGVSGWRGLIRVIEIAAIADSSFAALPGVVIDRFSGGTLDSALYTTEAFAGTRFAITLQLDGRRCGDTEWPTKQDIDLFDALIEDLTVEGLMLGHGVNRGFGWFEVERAT